MLGRSACGLHCNLWPVLSRVGIFDDLIEGIVQPLRRNVGRVAVVRQHPRHGYRRDRNVFCVRACHRNTAIIATAQTLATLKTNAASSFQNAAIAMQPRTKRCHTVTAHNLAIPIREKENPRRFHRLTIGHHKKHRQNGQVNLQGRSRVERDEGDIPHCLASTGYSPHDTWPNESART
jgi:hypothetical protein